MQLMGVHASFNVIEQLTFRFDAQAGLDQPIELGQNEWRQQKRARLLVDRRPGGAVPGI